MIGKNLLLLLCFICTEEVCGRLLKWMHSTRYDYYKNWSVGRVPCSEDTVVFPEKVAVEIFLPRDKQNLKELVLPSDGELILRTSSQVAFSSKGHTDPSCSGKDSNLNHKISEWYRCNIEAKHLCCGGGDGRWYSRLLPCPLSRRPVRVKQPPLRRPHGIVNVWLAVEAVSWADPENWSGNGNSAAPDLERIPCPKDTVEFQYEGIFKVRLPASVVPRVAAVKLTHPKMKEANGAVIYKDIWDLYLNMAAGQRQFVGGTLEATGENCTDPAGCECQKEMMPYVCAEITCPEPQCLQPVLAPGDCCKKCGAFLEFNFSPDTSLKKVEEVVSSVLGDKVTWYVSRTMGRILVNLRQEDDSQNIDELVKHLKIALLPKHFGLTSHNLKSSGPYYGEKGEPSPLVLFLLSFLFVAVGFGASFFYFETNRNRWPRWLRGGGAQVFARFENISGIVEIRPGQRPSVSRLPLEEPKGFDNPMYSQDPVFAGEESLLTEDKSEDDDSSSGESNLSFDRKTVTTIAVNEDTSMQDVPIGRLID